MRLSVIALWTILVTSCTSDHGVNHLTRIAPNFVLPTAIDQSFNDSNQRVFVEGILLLSSAGSVTLTNIASYEDCNVENVCYQSRIYDLILCECVSEANFERGPNDSDIIKPTESLSRSMRSADRRRVIVSGIYINRTTVIDLDIIRIEYNARMENVRLEYIYPR